MNVEIGADRNLRKDIPNRKKIQLVWMAMFLLIVSSMSIPHGGATASAVIGIDPPALTVGDPLPTDSFTVNITLKNVEDMYGWQVKIYFDPAILNCTGAVYPTGHVFDGKQFVPVAAWITEDYVLFGATLYFEEDVFTGNGTLCHITFIGKAVGTSDLEFNDQNTYMLNFTLERIDRTLENGNVTVIPEFSPSVIVLLLITATLAAAILSKTARSKNRLDAGTLKR